MIQWVHRSTRGWSYGASVSDPRTGEIIKGHVSLGSLRVRQDYLIAQGIISKFDEGSDDPRMLTMALDRLRQLSAHEIGHTLGLAHNFAASTINRASVMDYPHPYVILNGQEKDLKSAYDQKIGEWDKRTILYGYGTPNQGESEETFLAGLIAKNKKDGLLFITDKDARPEGGMHPYAHLWDNGSDPIGELERIRILRRHVLDNMGTNSIKEGSPYSEIEKVLVPAYLMHRYQVDAASKIIGGVDFDYGIKPNPIHFSCIDIKKQKAALDGILKTLDIDFLELSEELVAVIPPAAYGYAKTRESFKGHAGALFDPVAAAEASASHSLKFLLNPERLSRINMYDDKDWNLDIYLNTIINYVKTRTGKDQYQLMLEKTLFIHLLKLKTKTKIDKQVIAMVDAALSSFFEYKKSDKLSEEKTAHRNYLRSLLSDANRTPETFSLPELSRMPPGSPIGCH